MPASASLFCSVSSCCRCCCTRAGRAFLTFYGGVCYKERTTGARVGWFVAIMLLGNMAMAAYVLLQLKRLEPGQPVASILSSRGG